MCNQCDDLGAQIEKYQALLKGFSDKQALEAINALIRKLEAEKKALHPAE